MAKMTLTQLQAFCKSYVNWAKQAGAWTESRDNLLGLIDKVGMQITLDGSFQDKLPELDGQELPLGKTIEEYFIDLTLPADYDANGSTTLAPHYPSVEDAVYSYSLGRKTIATTQPFDNVERSAISAESASNMVAKIIERLNNSATLYRYNVKKQLLGNAIDKACAVSLYKAIAKPVDTDTSEAFIEEIKKDVEDASFANEGNSLSKALIGSAPELTLYIKKGVMPVVEVQALAGAFHAENLALPCTVKVVDDFGTLGEKNRDAYAVLVDPRGIKLHRGYHAVREQVNAEGDFINFYDHSEYTGFISKFTYIKVFKETENA